MISKSISNNELLALIKTKSKEEKHLTLEVIQLIREIERRRLFLELGFGSLFDYVVKELGYEEGAAIRRISAARLIRDMPEIEQKVAEGKLSLSNLNQVQNFFRKEEKLFNKKLPIEAKREVLELIENKSSRDVQKTLIQLSPNQISLKESQRVISEDLVEVKVIISDKLKSKLDKLKNLLSHTNINMTQAELIEKLADMALMKLDPTKKKLSNLPPTSKVQKDTAKLASNTLTSKNILETSPVGLKQEASGFKNRQAWKRASRHIPSTIKQEVYMRDKGCCTFTDQKTNRRCNSRHLLQYDHIKPMAFNGKTSIDNLRLLCFQHHKLVTEKMFGTR